MSRGSLRTGDTVLLILPSPPWVEGVPMGGGCDGPRYSGPTHIETAASGNRRAKRGGHPFSPGSDAQAERPCAAEARRGPFGIGEHLGGRGAAPRGATAITKGGCALFPLSCRHEHTAPTAAARCAQGGRGTLAGTPAPGWRIGPAHTPGRGGRSAASAYHRLHSAHAAATSSGTLPPPKITVISLLCVRSSSFALASCRAA